MKFFTLLAFALCSILHPASSHAAFDIIDDSGNTVEFHSKIVKNTDGIINDDLSTITFSFVSVDSNGVKQPPQTLGSLNNPIYTFSELKSAATRENIKGHAKILGALVVFAATSEAATIVISTVGLGEAFTAAVFGKLPVATIVVSLLESSIIIGELVYFFKKINPFRNYEKAGFLADEALQDKDQHSDNAMDSAKVLDELLKEIHS